MVRKRIINGMRYHPDVDKWTKCKRKDVTEELVLVQGQGFARFLAIRIGVRSCNPK